MRLFLNKRRSIPVLSLQPPQPPTATSSPGESPSVARRAGDFQCTIQEVDQQILKRAVRPQEIDSQEGGLSEMSEAPSSYHCSRHSHRPMRCPPANLPLQPPPHRPPPSSPSRRRSRSSEGPRAVLTSTWWSLGAGRSDCSTNTGDWRYIILWLSFGGGLGCGILSS